MLPTAELKAKLEIALLATQSLFYAVSAAAALLAFLRYSASVRRRTAETLLELEGRFKDYKEIARLIDPASGRYRELAPAVARSLRGAGKEPGDEPLIESLDAFLRFLLLLSGLHANGQLDRKSLARMYHYWFAAVYRRKELKDYVEKYFPKLSLFLEKYQKDFLAHAPPFEPSPSADPLPPLSSP